MMLTVFKPMIFAIWITLRPTPEFAPFCTTTSPGWEMLSRWSYIPRHPTRAEFDEVAKHAVGSGGVDGDGGGGDDGDVAGHAQQLRPRGDGVTAPRAEAAATWDHLPCGVRMQADAPHDDC